MKFLKYIIGYGIVALLVIVLAFVFLIPSNTDEFVEQQLLNAQTIELRFTPYPSARELICKNGKTEKERIISDKEMIHELIISLKTRKRTYASGWNCACAGFPVIAINGLPTITIHHESSIRVREFAGNYILVDREALRSWFKKYGIPREDDIKEIVKIESENRPNK